MYLCKCQQKLSLCTVFICLYILDPIPLYNFINILIFRSVNFQTSNGASAVYLAAQEGQCEILELLVQNRRGNAKIKAYDGMSSLHAAAQSGHMDCIRFLVSVFTLK